MFGLTPKKRFELTFKSCPKKIKYFTHLLACHIYNQYMTPENCEHANV